MKNINFIKKYLTPYLLQCRTYNPLFESKEATPVPPTSQELKMLVSYLQEREVDFAIVGSIAIARYLELAKEDIRLQTFRPTYCLEILIANAIPPPPKGWQFDEESRIWLYSKNNSCVQFFRTADVFPQEQWLSKIGKDPESVTLGCPVADLLTLCKMKLNSDQTKDMLELVTLIRKKGLPTYLEDHLWNNLQRKRLELIKTRCKIK